MKRISVLVAALLVPLVAGGVLQQQDAVLVAGNQAGPAQLLAGDIGTPTIGLSGHSASVAVGTLPLLVANDVLRIESTNASWEVHAEIVSQSGWDGAESITLSLADGALVEPQVIIALGALTKQFGNPVDLPVGGADTEIRVVGVGTGTLSVDLVLTPDGATSPELRFRVDLTV